MVALLASFTTGRALAPRTTSSYMSSVKKFLPNQGVDTSFFNKSQYIANTKAGIALQYRVTTNRTAKDATRLPVTADMIITYHKGAVHREPTLLQRALLAAQLTGFFTAYQNTFTLRGATTGLPLNTSNSHYQTKRWFPHNAHTNTHSYSLYQ
jgi:hypothetical protein